jgi:WXG100 family type VII secretion target
MSGSSQFTVDLEQFSEAITTVTTCQSAISTDFSDIKSELTKVLDAWSGPAAESYSDVQKALDSAMQTLENVLGQIVSRMNVTYSNYLNAEQANSSNLT